MSNAFSHISNPGLLTPETPGTATLKFGHTNPRRPCDRGLTHTIIAMRITLGITPSTTIIAMRKTLGITPSTTPARESAESTEFGV